MGEKNRLAFEATAKAEAAGYQKAKDRRRVVIGGYPWFVPFGRIVQPISPMAGGKAVVAVTPSVAAGWMDTLVRCALPLGGVRLGKSDAEVRILSGREAREQGPDRLMARIVDRPR